MTKIEKAVTWAINVAGDSTHGYDQTHRWGPDYDCSSFVISAWEQAGVPVKSFGATYTGNMFNAFCKNGFVVVSDGSLKRGDVLLHTTKHTAMYIGNNQIVEAAINEFGKTTGGQTGDQTNEIRVRSYYNYPWEYVLRYTGDDDSEKPSDTIKMEPSRDYAYTKLSFVQQGMTGGDVLSVQVLLHHKWGITLDCDAEFGPLTKQAVESFQGWKNLEVDGVVGPETYAALIGGHK